MCKASGMHHEMRFYHHYHLCIFNRFQHLETSDVIVAAIWYVKGGAVHGWKLMPKLYCGLLFHVQLDHFGIQFATSHLFLNTCGAFLLKRVVCNINNNLSCSTFYTLYRKSVVEDLIKACVGKGYVIQMETTVGAARKRYHIQEVLSKDSRKSCSD